MHGIKSVVGGQGPWIKGADIGTPDWKCIEVRSMSMREAFVDFEMKGNM